VRGAALLLLGSAFLALAGCEAPASGEAAPSAKARPSPEVAASASRQESIQAATAFLASACDARGRFAYRLHVERLGDQSEGDYNVLRHAGALYALEQAWRAQQDPAAAAALKRGARYLVQHHLRSLTGKPAFKVIASRTGEEVSQPTAKLGGAGLGLVALCAARRLDEEIVSLDDLRGLGRFVLWSQRVDGSFRAKYFLEREEWSSFVSLYYPGEAILGLLRLYALDPNPAWLEGAAKAAAFLARSRRDLPRAKLPHDHWLLIAGGELLPRWGELERPPAPRAEVRLHLDRLASLFLSVQEEINAVGRYPGSFHAGGAVCPSATRVEGLVGYASLGGEPSRSAPTRAQLVEGIQLGARFLERAQLRTDPRLRGAFPRGFLEASDEPLRRRGEVRVDFTQHSLSALLGAAQIGRSR
jgi:hypothetical protein